MTHTPAGDFDYEAKGRGYSQRRKSDPRIESLLHKAIGSARTVINVGAGAGSYEPRDRFTIAVEPSAMMRSQRPSDLPAVIGRAEDLPFDDASFDAAMATLTVHQWSNPVQGLHELRRVSRGPVVVLTFDGNDLHRFWLSHYAPELIEAERQRFLPIDLITRTLGGRTRVVNVPIPRDCTDGFTEAFYARPHLLADAAVRSGQSAWGFVDSEVSTRFERELRDDLASGRWHERFGHWLDLSEYPGALRLIVAEP